MTFLTITSSLIITDQFIGALCNTLVHSLWEGLLLSAVTGLIIIFTRKASAVTRYNLLITALLLFAVAASVTFFIQFNREQITGISGVLPTVRAGLVGPPVIANDITAIETTGFTNQLFGYLNNHHNAIVLVWFLVICAKSIQLVIGLLGIRRLRQTNIIPANSYWYDKMQQLADELNISQVVGLLESGLAKMPMVIGNLKPVILIPIGLLTTLSTEEVEAILVHELAHIKRRDYLVNLLQGLIEIVFFFNPAVLWISQLIKTERENCCDDLALAQSSNKVNYIRALVSCEEYQQAIPAYAIGFTGGKHSLIDRIKRMASNRNHSLNLFEKTMLAVCLVVSGLCFSAFSQQEKVENMADTVVKVIHHINVNQIQQQELVNPTPPLKKQLDKINKNVAVINTNATGLMAADTLPSKTEQHSDRRIDAVTSQTPPVNVRLDPLNVRLDNVNVSTNLKADVKANVNTSVNVVARVDTTIKKIVTVHYADKNTKKSAHSINQVFTYKTDSVYKKNYNYNYHPKVNVNYRYTNKNDSVYKVNSNYKYTPKIDVYSKGYSADTSKKSFPKSGPLVLARPMAIAAPKLKVNPSTPSFADELLKAGLINNKGNFKAELNNKELVINGVKQSEENHQLMLQKFMKKTGDKVNLSFSQIQ
ncbi:M56 family metallopeptidase [Mucilaginibacter sp. UR6-11]|uniref:M56 family metallopeptidase n=1 Tax=Mucilaginibacter sp. UR6-11 TaxID=1435644 RepID=UPI001E2C92BD|nr:M56 family metallopeptidase [Mucilaginibacter sp. UR6-11]MCC8424272.1 M56 family metallopeptidase [Mucilaginibacter sp. UR6-11]